MYRRWTSLLKTNDSHLNDSKCRNLRCRYFVKFLINLTTHSCLLMTKYISFFPIINANFTSQIYIGIFTGYLESWKSILNANTFSIFSHKLPKMKIDQCDNWIKFIEISVQKWSEIFNYSNVISTLPFRKHINNRSLSSVRFRGLTQQSSTWNRSRIPRKQSI